MSWKDLSEAIVVLVSADTGSGGLKEPSGPNFINGPYNTVAPQTAVLPYLVMTPVSATEFKSFAKDAFEYEIDFDIYTDVRATPNKGNVLADQLWVAIDRQAPLIDLSSPFSADKMRRISAPVTSFEIDRMVTTVTFRVFVYEE